MRPKDLKYGSAISFQECQKDVAAVLKGKILVGHALKNDLDVLLLSHPRAMIRDTATYRPYMRAVGKSTKYRPRALKDLTKQHLKLTIQEGEHDPAEDARSALELYKRCMSEWEKSLLQPRAKRIADVSSQQEAESSDNIVISNSIGDQK